MQRGPEGRAVAAGPFAALRDVGGDAPVLQRIVHDTCIPGNLPIRCGIQLLSSFSLRHAVRRTDGGHQDMVTADRGARGLQCIVYFTLSW